MFIVEATMQCSLKFATSVLFVIFFFILFNSFEVKADQIPLSGDTRYDTAVSISKEGWTTSATVILAQGMNFPDALASVPLAKKLNAPILLTQSQKVPDVTLNEIKRLNAKNIIILGGYQAVSKTAEDTLVNTLHVSVRRIAGAARFKTAEAIASQLGKYTNAFIVNANNYPDALSIAPYAAHAGSTRYATSAEVLETFYRTQPNFYFATGEGFADALTGAALAAKNSSGVTLIEQDEIPNEIQSILPEYEVSNSYILGGTNAVSASVSADLDSNVISTITDKSKPIIFYIPHADDEVLADGAGIDYYLEQGFDVHVVLMTDGEASSVYNTLKVKFPDMTLQDFGEARIREFEDALSRLGVKEENIQVENFPDMGLTVDDVKSVIMDYENKYPGAYHIALSYEEVHPDHLATGIALNDLYWSGLVKNARFFISSYLQSKIDGYYIEPINPGKVRDALNAYKVYDPSQGRYAIGYTSVPAYFNAVENDPVSKVQMPDKNYVDTGTTLTN